MKKNPILFYSVCIGALAFAQCVLAIPVSLIADKTVVKEILYYLTGLLGAVPPFLMLGFASFRQTTGRFSASLHPFWFYLSLSLIKQPVLALLAYLFEDGADFLTTLLAGLINELLYAAILFLLLLLGNLLFVRRRVLLADDRFFTLLSTEGRILLLTVGCTFAVSLVSEVWSILQDASARLWLIDLIDVGNYLFALLYLAATALLSYSAGRYMQLCCARALSQS